uniref:Integrase catalytic domain-containing protein n=1 Tax=Chromera velia CCMP2878 TaxID=1169474 RepID=A0A0G4G2H2_9ALVE|eukprot:Cvel_4075.t1-p1 / transcript=Cvel_4075.t1 / gene=Cvel_4075 / organism=Chromera_velia_CCMP2878 / gene_product=hypothetical protein / transcript_product=hypothetical protein / location=Cvel_scaffold173:111674-112411(-) / protein_length=246 / sequence_SO=supercontig / SO=protein_coding / is_pseudo=false
MTPQSQGLVERVNATLKSVLRKLFLSISVPAYLWPSFLEGVAQQMNETVHSHTRKSPNSAIFKESPGVCPVTVRNRVRFVDRAPSLQEGFAPKGGIGFFGGVLSSKAVSVVLKCKGGWQTVRIHLSQIRLYQWVGECSSNSASTEAPDDSDRSDGGSEWEEESSDAFDLVMSKRDSEGRVEMERFDEGAVVVEADAEVPPPTKGGGERKGLIVQRSGGMWFPVQVVRQLKRRIDIVALKPNSSGTG